MTAPPHDRAAQTIGGRVPREASELTIAHHAVPRRRANAADRTGPMEATWPVRRFTSLLAAPNTVMAQTVAKNHLDSLRCSHVRPDAANRCRNATDANWTSPFGFGAWASGAARLDRSTNPV